MTLGAATAALAISALLLQATLLPQSEASCVRNAIPEENRINIESLDGTGQVPFGIWTLDWDSARLVSYVAKILAEEVLGYNTVISGVGGSSASGLYATAGCQLPNEFATDPRCGPSPAFTHHASLEIWGLSKITTMRQKLAAWPEIIPEDAGDMGYEGIQGTYVFTQQKELAYQAEGLSLEYYRSYDVSWTRPWVYFDTISSFNPSELQPCNQTRFMDSTEIHHYVRVTGDWEGVVEVGNGTLAARCWFGSWWLAPACRNTPERCIPSVTGSDGWFVHDFMQRAAVFDMPLALTVGKPNIWQAVARERRCLPYWFQPDAAFIDLLPSIITFPPFNALERAQNIRTSMADNSRLSKWIHNRLGFQASSLRQFLKRVSLGMGSINDMLLMIKRNTTLSHEQVACEWLGRNEHIWRDWIPVKTECISGNGLIHEDGSFVTTRANASSCDWCPPGRYSTQHTDDLGTTYICLRCTPGSSQPNPGQLACDECQPGTFAEGVASRECMRCERGHYQNGTASTTCQECMQPMTTMVLGAVDASECVCPEDMFQPAGKGHASPCTACLEGLECRIGSAEENIPRARGASSGGEYPRPLPMYYAKHSEPLSVYECLSEFSCPGGDFDVCGQNMEGAACGRCLVGYYRTFNSGCRQCSDLTQSRWLLIILILLVGPLLCCLLYRFSQDPLHKWGSPINAIAAALFLTLIYIQIIATVRTCYLRYPPMLGNSFEWTVVSVEFLSLLRPECTHFTDFKLGFILRLLTPVYAAALFSFTFLASRLAERSNRNYHMDGHAMMGCYGSVYNTFFIGIAAQTFTLFQCYEHPNKRRSLLSAPDVLCDSQTWKDLLAVAIPGMLVFCGGALTLFAYINIKAPAHFHEEEFRKKWRFLFMKFRPTVWWWGTLLLVKGVWLNLTTVIFDVGHLQIVWLIFAHLLYLVVCFTFLPWRSMGVAALDVGMHAMIVLFFSQLPHFAVRSEESGQDMARLSLACWVAPLCGTVVLVLTQLRLKLRPMVPLEWLAQAEEVCAVFSRVDQVERVKSVLELLPTADLWTLSSTKNMLEAELFGGQVPPPAPPRRTSGSSTRLSMIGAMENYRPPSNATTTRTTQVPRLLSSFRGSGSGKSSALVPGQQTGYIVV